MFPDEIYKQIVKECPIASYPGLAQSNSRLAGILLDEPFWREKCLAPRWAGERHAPTAMNEAAPIGSRGQRGRQSSASWRAAFKRQYVIERNWRLNVYDWRNIDTDGHVCLTLDGERNRALSARLPLYGPSLPSEGAILNDGREAGLLAGRGGISQGLLWDVERRVALGRLSEDALLTTAAIDSINLLAIGTRDGIVAVRDVRLPLSKSIARFVAHRGGEVAALAFQHGTLATGSSDGSIGVWDFSALLVEPYGTSALLPHQAAEGPVGMEGITAIAVSQSKHVIAGSVEGSLLVSDGSPSGRWRTLPAASMTLVPPSSAGSAVNCISIDGQFVMVGDDAGIVRGATIGALCEGRAVAAEGRAARMSLCKVSASPIVCMHNDASRLVMGHANGSLSSLSLSTLTGPSRPAAGIDEPSGSPTSQQAAQNGHSSGGDIEETERGICRIEAERGVIWQVQLDSSRIISSSLDRLLHIHDYSREAA